jgi:hypothetical protein
MGTVRLAGDIDRRPVRFSVADRMEAELSLSGGPLPGPAAVEAYVE